MSTPGDISQADIETIYSAIERAASCENFVDRAAGCTLGESDCRCFALGKQVMAQLRSASVPPRSTGAPGSYLTYRANCHRARASLARKKADEPGADRATCLEAAHWHDTWASYLEGTGPTPAGLPDRGATRSPLFAYPID